MNRKSQSQCTKLRRLLQIKRPLDWKTDIAILPREVYYKLMEQDRSWAKTIEFLKEARSAGGYRTPTNKHEDRWAIQLATTLSYAATPAGTGMRKVADIYRVTYETVNQRVENTLKGVWANSPRALQIDFPLDLLAFGKPRVKEKREKKREPQKIFLHRTDSIHTVIDAIRQRKLGGVVITFPRRDTEPLREISKCENPAITTWSKAMFPFYYSNERDSGSMLRTILDDGITVFETRRTIKSGAKRGHVMTYRWLLTETVGAARESIRKNPDHAAILTSRVTQLGGQRRELPRIYDLNRRNGRYSSITRVNLENRDLGKQFRAWVNSGCFDQILRECEIPVFKTNYSAKPRYYCASENLREIEQYLVEVLKKSPGLAISS